MDTQTIDQEYDKLQTEFQDVAGSVKALADKMQTAAAAGDANATAWLDDLKLIAKDIDDEQGQAHTLLLAIHGFITNLAQLQSGEGDDRPPLFAPGQSPQEQDAQQGQVQQMPQRHGILGGMFGGGMMGGGMMGGGMMGGGMFGGYGRGGFAQAMEMGAGFSLGADLLNSIFR